MSVLTINTVRYAALFSSSLQRSDEPSIAQVHHAVREAVRRSGSRGCVAQVAQEFGDHPETAVERMRWARHTVDAAFSGPPRVTAVPAPRQRARAA